MTDSIDWQQIRDRAPYAPEAFRFVREGLNHTLERIAGPHTSPHDDASQGVADVADQGLGGFMEPEAHTRHVSGQELCMGLRSYAVERYGLLAKTVLRGWGVLKTEDFGKIVYAMVDAGLMRTSEHDSMDDFRGVYEFDEAFEGPANPCADANADTQTDRHNAGAGEVG